MAFPRGLNKVQMDNNFLDIYNFFRSKYPNNPVRRIKYKRIIREFNQRIVDAIIYDNLCFVLPARMGLLRIRKKKVYLKIKDNSIDKRYLRPDWKKSLEKWRKLNPGLSDAEIKKIPDKKIIYHLNDHSNGYYFRWYWDKSTCNVHNHSVYKFEPARTARLKITEALKHENIDYYE